MKHFFRHGIVGLLLLLPSVVLATVNITEIAYDLAGSDSNREWIEIYNDGAVPVTIKGGTAGQDSWRIYHKTSAGVESNKTLATDAFQGTMTLEPGAYAVVVQDGIIFKGDYPSYSGSIFVSSALTLANTSATVGLRLSSAGVPWSVVEYNSEQGANGDGKSLQLVGSLWQAGTPTPGSGASSGSQAAQASSTTTEDEQEADAEEEDAEEPPPPPPGSGASTWVYKPQIFVSAIVPTRGVAGAPLQFDAVAVGTKKEPLLNARYVWSFGDGGTTEGKKVMHTYHYPGAYTVLVDASSGEWSALDRKEVVVVAPELVISGIKEGASGFIEIRNNGGSEVDLSRWILQSGAGMFTFPQGTHIGARKTVPFPSAITNLSANEDSTMLLYPNGMLVVRYTGDSGTAVVLPEAETNEPTVSATVAQGRVEEKTVTSLPILKEKTKDEVGVPLAPLSSSTELLGAVGASASGGVSPWLLAVALLCLIGAGGYFALLRQKPQPDSADILRKEAAGFEIME